MTRNSLTSKPIPPAPTTATLSPTGLPRIASAYDSTIGWSMPGMSGIRGVTPVASTTSSNPVSASMSARVSSRTSTPCLSSIRV